MRRPEANCFWRSSNYWGPRRLGAPCSFQQTGAHISSGMHYSRAAFPSTAFTESSSHQANCAAFQQRTDLSETPEFPFSSRRGNRSTPHSPDWSGRASARPIRHCWSSINPKGASRGSRMATRPGRMAFRHRSARWPKAGVFRSPFSVRIRKNPRQRHTQPDAIFDQRKFGALGGEAIDQPSCEYDHWNYTQARVRTSSLGRSVRIVPLP